MNPLPCLPLAGSSFLLPQEREAHPSAFHRLTIPRGLGTSRDLEVPGHQVTFKCPAAHTAKSPHYQPPTTQDFCNSSFVPRVVVDEDATQLHTPRYSAVREWRKKKITPTLVFLSPVSCFISIKFFSLNCSLTSEVTNFSLPALPQNKPEEHCYSVPAQLMWFGAWDTPFSLLTPHQNVFYNIIFNFSSPPEKGLANSSFPITVSKREICLKFQHTGLRHTLIGVA